MTASRASSRTSTPGRPGSGSESLDSVINEQGRQRAPLHHAQAARTRPRAAGRRACPAAAPTTSTPFRRRANRGSPATRTSRRRIRAFIRWNAAIMVSRASRPGLGVGGHIATYASSATPLRGRLQPLLPRQGPRRERRPDLLPGPRRPGIYARAFLEAG
ncbi:hypothetical protein ACU686_38635 [Yinghuangia aomiensis]